MELGAIARGVARRWRTLVATILVCIALSGLISLLMPVRYQALTTVFVSTGTASGGQDLYSGGSFARDRVKSYAQAIPMPVILQPVVTELRLDMTPDELAERIETSVPLDSVLIDIRVTDGDPLRAARIANAVAREFSAAVPKLEDPAGRAATPVTVSVLREATPPEHLSSPNVPRNLAIGLALGIALGIVLAAIRDQSDTRIRSEEQVRRTFDLPILGAMMMLPKKADPLVVDSEPMGQRAESYRSLRSNLQFFGADQALQTISITSANPGEGKSTVAANLALAMGETDEKICLVEADLRKPRVLSYLGMEGAAGLTNVLIGEVALDDVLQEYAGRNLTVLGAGRLPPNPSELLGSQAMDVLLADLKTRFHRIIIDTPPLLPVTDGAVLASRVDGVVLVVGAELAELHDISRSAEILHRSHAHLLGLVLNRLKVRSGDRYAENDAYASDIDFDSTDRPRRGR